MSDTPRTDAECMSGETRFTDMVHYTFAQQLERELADANADYMALARRLDGHDVNECLLNLNRLKAELAEAREQWRMSSVCRDLASQRNRLLAALQGVMDYRLGKPPYDFHQYREAERDNMAFDAWQVIEQNCMSLLAEIQGSTSDTPDINPNADK